MTPGTGSCCTAVEEDCTAVEEDCTEVEAGTGVEEQQKVEREVLLANEHHWVQSHLCPLCKSQSDAGHWDQRSCMNHVGFHWRRIPP